eukprot:gene4563-16541_t
MWSPHPVTSPPEDADEVFCYDNLGEGLCNDGWHELTNPGMIAGTAGENDCFHAAIGDTKCKD